MLRCCVAVMLRQRFGGIKIKLYLCTWLSEDQHTEKRESRFLDTSYKATGRAHASRWDRYLGITAPMTQDLSPRLRPVPTATAQFGDTYPAMKPKDWMHLIRDYLTRKGEPSFDEEDDSVFPAMAAEE